MSCRLATRFSLLLVAICVGGSVITFPFLHLASKNQKDRAPKQSGATTVSAGSFQLPLSFEPNLGQADPRVLFLTHGQGYTLFLAASEAVLALSNQHSKLSRGFDGLEEPQQGTAAVIRMRLLGASKAEPAGLEKQRGTSNYLIGKDRRGWKTNIPHFGVVRYPRVYPKIDMLFHGSQSALEYDFVLDPGADPNRIAIRFDGVDHSTVDSEGNLLLTVGDRVLVHKKPLIYQENGGGRKVVPGDFALRADGSVGFQLGAYDKSSRLIIDPNLSYSTFLGGTDSSNNGAFAVAVDSSGAAYIIGESGARDFPVTPEAFQGTSRFDCNPHFCGHNAFVTKLNPEGTDVIYSTYLGGTHLDLGFAITVSPEGIAYVAGVTRSVDFPTTPGAFQRRCGVCEVSNAFVAALNPSGSDLVFSTLLGDPSGWQGDTYADGIAVDASANVYIVGSTAATNLPTTPTAFQPRNGGGYDAFIAKFDSLGSSLLYLTYLGGRGNDGAAGIAVDDFGNAFVSGGTASEDFPVTPGVVQPSYGGQRDPLGLGDGFVTKLNAAGTDLLFSTYLGGSDGDTAGGLAIDSEGKVWVTGSTESKDFPVTRKAFQGQIAGQANAFVTNLNPEATALLFSTYLGGNGSDYGARVALDASGNVWTVGSTNSTNFPVTDDAFQSALGGADCYGRPCDDAFLFELGSNGASLLYSTYFGGSGEDAGNGLALDPMGRIYLTGITSSSNFPTTNGAFQVTCPSNPCGAGFVAKFEVKRNSR